MPIAFSAQLTPRVVRRSRPPYNLRRELHADRVLRTTCATSCTPIASSVQLAPRAVRRSRPPYNLRHELYADRVLRTTCATSCTPIASSVQLAQGCTLSREFPMT